MVFVWGGLGTATAPEGPSGADDQELDLLPDGATYNLETHEWRAFESSATFGRVGAGGTWTGTEFVVWGGFTDSESHGSGGEAYDPEKGTWRAVPEAPIPGRYQPQLIWSGREVLVVGGTPHRTTDTTSIVGWDPAANEWRNVAELPSSFAEGVMSVSLWGHDLLVWGGCRRP